MKVIIASTNPSKVKAVSELISKYDLFLNVEIEGKSADSEVSDQPMSLEETIKGAINRANAVFNSADYSFGIETGLMEVPYTKGSFMNVCVCAIFDGKNIHLGLSSGFELPKKVIELIKNKGMNMSDSCIEAGLTNDKNLKNSGGLISLLTKGGMDRQTYTSQAIMNALIHLENSDLFQ